MAQNFREGVRVEDKVDSRLIESKLPRQTFAVKTIRLFSQRSMVSSEWIGEKLLTTKPWTRFIAHTSH